MAPALRMTHARKVSFKFLVYSTLFYAIQNARWEAHRLLLPVEIRRRPL